MPPFDSLVSMLTIHNIAYQGSFWHWDMELTGIDWKYFNWRQMEFYGNLNFLKSGLAFADVITHRQPPLRPGNPVAAAELRPGRHPFRIAATTCSASSTASTTAFGIRRPIPT